MLTKIHLRNQNFQEILKSKEQQDVTEIQLALLQFFFNYYYYISMHFNSVFSTQKTREIEIKVKKKMKKKKIEPLKTEKNLHAPLKTLKMYVPPKLCLSSALLNPSLYIY